MVKLKVIKYYKELFYYLFFYNKFSIFSYYFYFIFVFYYYYILFKLII